jgi:hypothetical protein
MAEVSCEDALKTASDLRAIKAGQEQGGYL